MNVLRIVPRFLSSSSVSATAIGGRVALALPVWAGLFKGLSGSHETFAYTGRASATHPQYSKVTVNMHKNHLVRLVIWC